MSWGSTASVHYWERPDTSQDCSSLDFTMVENIMCLQLFSSTFLLSRDVVNPLLKVKMTICGIFAHMVFYT